MQGTRHQVSLLRQVIKDEDLLSNATSRGSQLVKVCMIYASAAIMQHSR